jgi:N5-(carboxyethyl)ornithine synthase
MIIDISCDEGMGIESSHPTALDDPVYVVDGVLHYAVDHTPTLFYREATRAISQVVADYVDQLVEGTHGECLRRATAIQDGVIQDERIIRFQGRST